MMIAQATDSRRNKINAASTDDSICLHGFGLLASLVAYKEQDRCRADLVLLER
jgi:hypothetical protein